MATRIEGDPAVRVKGVCHDSRVIERDELFVARSGERFDGARFVADAVARGASAVMAAPGSIDARAVAVPVLFASEPARALAFAASAVYGHPSFTVDVVGVTGTNGKTTTVHLVRAAIDGALGLPATGVLGTVGHRFRDWHRPAAHTTPEADEVARVLAAMRDRGRDLRRDGGLVARPRPRPRRRGEVPRRRLHQPHPGSPRLPRVDGVLRRGQGEALHRARGRHRPSSTSTTPSGSPSPGASRRLSVRVSARVAGDGGAADVAPRSVTIDARGIRAVVRTPAGDVDIASRLVGAHNLEESPGRAGSGPRARAGRGSGGRRPLGRARGARSSRALRCPGRRHPRARGLCPYARCPRSRPRRRSRHDAREGAVCLRLRRRPRSDQARTDGRRGGPARRRGLRDERQPEVRPPEAIAAAAAAGVRAAGVEPVVELDRATAIERAVLSAAPGDAVVIAGKGHEEYQIIGGVSRPFDDREQARRALALRRSQA